jgi:hypothetical protein
MSNTCVAGGHECVAAFPHLFHCRTCQVLDDTGDCRLLKNRPLKQSGHSSFRHLVRALDKPSTGRNVSSPLVRGPSAGGGARRGAPTEQRLYRPRLSRPRLSPMRMPFRSLATLLLAASVATCSDAPSATPTAANANARRTRASCPSSPSFPPRHRGYKSRIALAVTLPIRRPR